MIFSAGLLGDVLDRRLPAFGDDGHFLGGDGNERQGLLFFRHRGRRRQYEGRRRKRERQKILVHVHDDSPFGCQGCLLRRERELRRIEPPGAVPGPAMAERRRRLRIQRFERFRFETVAQNDTVHCIELVPLHRGNDRLKISHLSSARVSLATSQPVRITVQRY